MNAAQESPRPGLPDQHPLKTQNDLLADKPQDHVPAQAPPSTVESNGIPAGRTIQNGTSRIHVESAPADPPELQHWSDSYVPFQQILQRVAQDTFHELNQHIEVLSESAIPPRQTANGLAVQPPVDDSKESVAKKLSLIKFAHDHKDRFVKALVLTEWARDMGQMDRLIELTMWLRQQDDLANEAAHGIVGLKQAMVAAKMPNPNIDGALTMLSTGKAPWMPDLGYVPRKPLSAHNLLKTFKDIEFILFTRLNLHETIPPELEDFRIGNGRATFVVKDQFELDIAAADDDPLSPLYFVDFRSLLPHSTPIGDGPLRDHLESTINQTLAAGGLGACYDYLHDYLLTFRIAKLRSQAQQLATRKWNGELQVQQLHRSLILQYWVSGCSTGSKHWIEIGIASAKASQNLAKAPGSGASVSGSTLFCRWIRNGQEVLEHSLGRALRDNLCITAEALLDRVVAQHSSGRLVQISKCLAQWALGSTTYEQSLMKSDVDPAGCCLTARLHRFSRSVKATVEPITGRYVLSPASHGDASAKMEYFSQVASAIRNLVYRQFFHPLTEEARSIGWTPLDVTFTPNGFSSSDAPRSQSFAVESFGPEWALCVCADLKQTNWYIIRVQRSEEHVVVSESTLLVSSLWGRGVPRSSRQLVGLESHAVTKTSFTTLVKELGAADIAFDVQTRPVASQSAYDTSTVVTLQAVDLLDEGFDDANHVWTRDLLEVKHVGIDGGNDPAVVSHVLTGVLTDTARISLVKHVSRDACRASGLDVTDDGVWQITVDSPLGGSLLSRLISRIWAAQRLFTYIACCRRHRFAIKVATMDQFAFQYAAQPPLLAEIDSCSTGADNATATGCKFRLTVGQDKHVSGPLPGNPHARLVEQLRTKLNGGTFVPRQDNGRDPRHFDQLCQALRFTLPLMQTLCAIEDTGPPGRVMFNCHTATSFRLSYRAPLNEYIFAISSRFKGNKCVWFVQERRRRQGSNESINTKLAETWTTQGQGWVGLRNGAAAEVGGIEALLYRIDSVVRELDTNDQSKA